MVNTRMEARLDVLDKMIQEMVRDCDIIENETQDCLQRVEDVLRGLTTLVEKLSCGERMMMNIPQGITTQMNVVRRPLTLFLFSHIGES